MEKKKWSAEETKKFISLIEARPELWSKSCADYRNKIKKENSIKELCVALGCTSNEVIKKLKNLRTQFQAEMQKCKKKLSGSGATDTYKPADVFFLLPE